MKTNLNGVIGENIYLGVSKNVNLICEDSILKIKDKDNELLPISFGSAIDGDNGLTLLNGRALFGYNNITLYCYERNIRADSFTLVTGSEHYVDFSKIDTNVSCYFCVFGKRGGGTTAEFRLYDVTNSQQLALVSTTDNTAYDFMSISFTNPEQAIELQVQMRNTTYNEIVYIRKAMLIFYY